MTTQPAEAAVASRTRREPLHPWRWLGGIVVVVILALIVRAFALGDIAWSYVGRYFTNDAILYGARNTILVSVAAMILALVAGLVVALMRMSENPVAQIAAISYVWLFRGTPVYLQLLLWFNLALVFPVVDIPFVMRAKMVTLMTPFVAALLGLGLHQSGYIAEVIRSGILSIDVGQREAAQSIGMRRTQVMRRIVLPQAMRVIVPPLGNQFISLLKTSSLAVVVSYEELMTESEIVYSQNNRVMELLFVAAIWYLIYVTVLSVVQRYLERHFGKGFHLRRQRSMGARVWSLVRGLRRRENV